MAESCFRRDQKQPFFQKVLRITNQASIAIIPMAGYNDRHWFSLAVPPPGHLGFEFIFLLSS